MSSAAMSETARHVADSALEFGRNGGGVTRARAMRDRSGQLDVVAWNQVAELGWLGMRVSEEHGGIGVDADALAGLLESAGTVLLPEPVLPVIAAAGLLEECVSLESSVLLEQAIAGKLICLAVPSGSVVREPSGEHRLQHVPDCYPGAALLVPSGEGAEFALRLVMADAKGVHSTASACVDGSVLTSFTISAAAWMSSTVLGRGLAIEEAHARAADTMLLGYSAYLVGVMHEALQIALEYMKIRSQFGQPIGAFQALQHRAASCHVEINAARSLVMEAARAFDSPARARAAAIAKARCSAAALKVTRECVQFHGAIGFADEHDIGLYLRKAMTLGARMGNEAVQKRRLAAILFGAVPGLA